MTVIGTILFRVDAGPDVGLGHLRRCLSLATALTKRGALCAFLTNPSEVVLGHVSAAGFPVEGLSGAASWTAGDAKRLLEAAAKRKCAAVVVDSNHEGIEYLRKIRTGGFVTVAIEDLAPHPYPCHLVVNGDAHAGQLPYEAVAADTAFLLGPEYAILREEFWEVASCRRRATVRNVLVVMGGADMGNLSPRLVSLLDALPGDFTVTVVVGPFFENEAQIHEVVKDARREVRTVRSPVFVAPLMQAADLAISAAGQTLYELACVGCPTVAIEVADNQASQLRALAAAGAVRAAGRASEPNIFDKVTSTCRTLMRDQAVRSRMSDCSRRVVDGQGALRVAEAILATVGTWRSLTPLSTT